MAVLALLGLFVLSPVIAFFAAMFRGLVLFLPVMWALGFLHKYVEVVPNLGWKASFWLVAVLGLLIPTGSTASKD